MSNELEQQRWRRLVQVLLADAEQVRSDDARAEKYFEIAEVCRVQLGDSERAAPYYRRAAELTPRVARKAIDALLDVIDADAPLVVETTLIQLVETHCDASELAKILRTLAMTAASPERTKTHFEHAIRIALHVAQNQDQARGLLIAAHKRMSDRDQESLLPATETHLGLWPADESVAALRAMLLVGRNRAREAVETILDAAAHTADTRIKAKLRLRAAALCVDELRQPLDAISALRDALAIDPSVSVSAQDILDSIVDGWDVTKTIVDELVDAYDSIRKPESAQRVWALCIERTSPNERAGLYLRQAQHAEHNQLDATRRFKLFHAGAQSTMGDLSPYIVGMRRATWDGADGGFEHLALLLEAEESWTDLVELFDDYAALVPEDEARAHLTYRAGCIAAEHLADNQGALNRYLQALRLDPNNDLYASAAELKYRDSENWERVDGMLDTRFSLVSDRAQKVDIRLEQGRLRHRQLAQPVAAYDILRDALRLAGDEFSDLVSEALADLVGDIWAFPAIEKQIVARIEQAGDSSKASRLELELSYLYLEFVRDVQKGLETLNSAAARSPSDASVFLRVTQQYEKYADDLTLARWLEGAREKPLNIAVKKNALEQALQIYQKNDAGWHVIRRVWDALLELDISDTAQVQAAVDAAEGEGDTGAVSHFLTLALDKNGTKIASEMVRLRWMRRLAEIHKSHGDLGEAVNRHRAILQQWPLDEDAFSGLSGCYRALEDWIALAELLRSRINLLETGTQAAQVNLRTQWAILLQNQLNDTGGAVAALEPLLHRRSLDEAASTLLAQLYQRAGNLPGQVRIIEERMTGAAPIARESYIAEMNALLESGSPSPELRERVVRHEIALTPEALEPRYRLLAVYREMDDKPNLLAALDDVWQMNPDRAQIAVLRERSQLLTDLADDLNQAIDSWEQYLGLDEDDDTALNALQKLYAQGERDDDVRRIIRRRFSISESDALKLALLKEEAILAEIKIGDSKGAFDAWSKAHDLASDDLTILEELIRLAETLGDVASLVRYGQRWFTCDRRETDLDLFRTIGRACDQSDESATAEACWRLILDELGDDGEALDRLATLAEVSGEVDLAISYLDRLAADCQPFENRKLALDRLIDVQSAADRYDAVVTVFHKLAALEPTAVEPWLRLETYAGEKGDVATVYDALKSAQELTVDPADVALLHRRLAHLAAGQVNDPRAAVHHWEAVLLIEHTAQDALNALWRLYCEQGRRLEMFRTLDTLARGATNVTLAGQYLADAANWVEDGQFDNKLAFECWLRSHALADGARRDSLERMAELAPQLGRWQDYVGALALSAEHSVDFEERTELRARAARVALTELNQYQTGFEYLQLAVSERPDRSDLVDELVAAARLNDDKPIWLGLAETLRFVAENTEASRAELFLEAGLALERCGREDEAFSLLSDAVTQSQGLVGDDAIFQFAQTYGYLDRIPDLFGMATKDLDASLRKPRLIRFATLFESVTDGLESALEYYLQAYQIEPNDDVIRQDIWRLADGLDAWPLVVRFFELMTDLTHDPVERFHFLSQRAYVEDEKLGDRGKAYSTLKRAVSLRPSDDEARRILESWADDEGMTIDVARFYEDEAAWVEESDARIGLYRRAVELHRSLGQTDDAARVLNLIEELAPDDERVIDERIKLLEDAAKFGELTTVLERQAGRTRGERRLHLLREVLRLHTARSGDALVAERAGLSILEEQPDDAAAFEAVAHIQRSREDWTALDDLLRQYMEHCSETLSIPVIDERIVIANKHFVKSDHAFDLSLVRFRLGGLGLDYLLRIEPLVTTRHQAGQLLGLLETGLEDAQDNTRLPVLLLVERLALLHLDRPQTALNALSEALSLSDGDIGLARRVADLQRRQKKHEDLVALFREFGPSLFVDASVESDEAFIIWHMELGELLELNILDFAAAAETYDALLAVHPENTVALNRLKRILVRLRDVPRLAAVVQQLAQLTEAPHDVLLLVEGARAIQGMGDLGAAVELWSQVLERAPSTEEAQSVVMRHGRREKDIPLMRSVFIARVKSARTAEDRANRFCETAEFERETAEDDQRAIVAYRDALAADGHSAHALMGLAELMLVHQDIDTIEMLGKLMIQRYDRGLDEGIREPFSGWLAHLQVVRALRRIEIDKTDDVLSLLDAAYVRAPHVKESSQLYADQLFAAGDIVSAGHIYDKTPLPSFLPGANGDVLRANEHLRRAKALAEIDLDVQAIHHFEAAARYEVTKADSYEALAVIQERSERWEAAARYWQKLSEVKDGADERAKAMAHAGLILQENLGRHHRAIKLYRSAIAEGLTDPLMLLKLLAAMESRGENRDILVIIERLVDAGLRGTTKAKLHIRRAELLSLESDFDAARDALISASSEHPEIDQFTEILLNMFEAYPDLALYEGRLLSILAIESLSGWTASHRLRLLRWYASHGHIEHALEISGRLRATGPQTFPVLDARAFLYGEIYFKTGRADALKQGLGDRLASILCRPGEVDALRDLVRLLEASDTPEHALTPLGLLNLLGRSTQPERMQLNTLMDTVELKDVNVAHVHSHQTQAAAAVDALLAHLIGLVGPSLDNAFRLARAEALDEWQAADNALSALSACIVASAGWDDFEYGHLSDNTQLIKTLGFAPPRVALNEDNSESYNRSESLFLLARTLFLSRGQFGFLSSIPPEESLGILAAAIALSEPENGPEYALMTGVGEASIEYWAVFLHENVNESDLTNMQSLTRAVVDAGVDAFLDWADWAYASANRFGLFISRDLAAAIKALKTESESTRMLAITGSDDFRELLTMEPSMARLYSYAFSPEFMGLEDVHYDPVLGDSFGAFPDMAVTDSSESPAANLEALPADPLDSSVSSDNNQLETGGVAPVQDVDPRRSAVGEAHLKSESDGVAAAQPDGTAVESIQGSHDSSNVIESPSDQSSQNQGPDVNVGRAAESGDASIESQGGVQAQTRDAVASDVESDGGSKGPESESHDSIDEELADDAVASVIAPDGVESDVELDVESDGSSGHEPIDEEMAADGAESMVAPDEGSSDLESEFQESINKPVVDNAASKPAESDGASEAFDGIDTRGEGQASAVGQDPQDELDDQSEGPLAESICNELADTQTPSVAAKSSSETRPDESDAVNSASRDDLDHFKNQRPERHLIEPDSAPLHIQDDGSIDLDLSQDVSPSMILESKDEDVNQYVGETMAEQHLVGLDGDRDKLSQGASSVHQLDADEGAALGSVEPDKQVDLSSSAEGLLPRPPDDAVLDGPALIADRRVDQSNEASAFRFEMAAESASVNSEGDEHDGSDELRRQDYLETAVHKLSSDVDEFADPDDDKTEYE